MKKIFTLLMISTVVAQAQTVGYTKTSIYDDFAKVGLYSDPNPVDLNHPDGIYWWGKALGGNSNDPCLTANEYVLTRSGNGKLGVLVSQGNQCWQPMGISTKLDLTKNSTFEVSITNTSAAAIYFNITIVDGNKKVSSCDANGVNFAISSLGAGETQVLSGDFAGGMRKVWVNGSSTLVAGADLATVIGVDMTIVSASQPENNAWNPIAITNTTATINYIKVGGAAAPDAVNTLSQQKITMYPNPSNGETVQFSQPLTNVQVYNALGQMVFFQNNASTINVGSLTQGIYFLSSNEGISKLVVE